MYTFSIGIEPCGNEQYLPYLIESLGHKTTLIINHNSKNIWSEYDPEKEYHFIIKDYLLIDEDFHDKLQYYLDITKSKELIYSLSTDNLPLVNQIPHLLPKHTIKKKLKNDLAIGINTKYLKNSPEQDISSINKFARDNKLSFLYTQNLVFKRQ